MFSKLLAVGCVMNTSSAIYVTSRREPLLEKVADIQAPPDAGHPVDYFVPDFGMDKDIVTS